MAIDAAEWYVQKGARVQGPFSAAEVGRFLLLGRVRRSDRVSRDGELWEPVTQVPELVPEALLDLESGEGWGRFLDARAANDERAGDGDRDGDRDVDAPPAPIGPGVRPDAAGIRLERRGGADMLARVREEWRAADASRPVPTRPGARAREPAALVAAVPDARGARGGAVARPGRAAGGLSRAARAVWSDRCEPAGSPPGSSRTGVHTSMAALSPFTDRSVVTSLSSVRAQRLDVQLRQLEFHAMLHRKLELERLFEAFMIEGQAFVRFDGVRYAAAERGADLLLGRAARHSQSFELRLGERALGRIVLMRATGFDAREERDVERLVESLVYPLDNALEHHEALMAVMTDRATGLRNQQCLERELPREIRLARRLGRTLSVLHVSVDYLESISEHHGAQAGEVAWAAVADTLAEALRRNDLMFRIDGEAFAIVLADAGIDDALALAERLRVGIGRGAEIDNVHFVLTASAGATELGAEDTADSLLERAALALSRARQGGRNRVVALASPDATDAPDGGGPDAA